jgi:hypothetical protein
MERPSTEEVFNREQENVTSDPFWGDDPNILFNFERSIEFFPTKDMSTNEKLNAISRFFIYLGILMFISFRNYNLLFIPIIALGILYVVFVNDKTLHEINIEQFDRNIKKELNINEDTPIKIDEVGDICHRPTRDNPVMNVLINEITDNPNRPPACYHNDPDVREETEKFFNYNLYKNVEDVLDKRNGQRQYFTMPWTTIPNDRDSFMKWCYKTTNVCKDGDLDYCLRYEDMRLPGN